MNRIFVRIAALLALVFVLAFASHVQTYAAEENVEIEMLEDNGNVTHSKAWAAGVTIAVVAAAGAIAMGLVIWKTVESIARQPEAEGKIRTAMMLGLVFVETAIIYSLIVAILIIFVL